MMKNMKQKQAEKISMRNSIWMKLFSLFLAICITVSMHPQYVQASGSYTADWQRWSQGASAYSAMKYGCRVTAYAKMLAEAGYTGFGNPDGFFEWGKANGYFRASDTYELKSIGTAPVTYVNGNGGTASLAGRQTLTGNKTTDASTIMNLINQGYYVILTCSAHSAYVGRADSIGQGTAVILDSWASASVGPAFQYRNYTQYTFTTANYFRIADSSAKDTTAPTISDVSVTDKNADGYTVTCRVEDAGGVAKVQFPTWTTYGDQDDLMASWWDSASCRGTQNGTTWSYRVHTSDHNNEEGFYNTHIYAWDAAGNSSYVHVNGIYVDRTPPVISEVQVVDMDATGYTVTCKVEDASSEITKVQFPTWTVEGGQDDLAADWMNNPSCRGTQNGTIWSYRVHDSAHNFERGIYRTHIYAWDSYGNSASASLNNIEFEATYRQVNSASRDGHTYHLYNEVLTWDEAKEKCEQLGGHLVTITSAEEQEAVAELVKGQARFAYWIGGRKDKESVWVTGEEFSYSNWAPGEPNEDGGEDSYQINRDSGTWNDYLGTKREAGFVCEWDGKQLGELGQPEESGTEEPGMENSGTESPVTFSIEPFANLDYTFQTIDGDTVSSKVLPTKDVTLLVFGRTTCASSWLTLRSIAESSWVQDPKVSVIYVDIEGADAEVIRSSIDYYAQLSEDTSKYYLGCEKIVFCQDADGKNDEARKMYHTLSGKWGTISLPMTILVDKKNIVREMLTGYQIADKILPVMNKVIVKGNAAEEEDKKDDTDKDDTGTGDTGNDNTGTGDSQKKPMVVRAEQVRLSKTNLTFNGKAQTPAVIARDSQGRQINSADYTVTYSNNINVGQATATIIFKNNYTGTVKKTFLIMPKGTSLVRLTSQKKGLTVKWKKQNSQINGYEIQYSASRNFKGAKTVKISKVKTASKKISRLKAKKRYYVRIRTYKTAKVDGMNLKLYSRWSKAKSVKTKK